MWSQAFRIFRASLAAQRNQRFAFADPAEIAEQSRPTRQFVPSVTFGNARICLHQTLARSLLYLSHGHLSLPGSAALRSNIDAVRYRCDRRFPQVWRSF